MLVLGQMEIWYFASAAVILGHVVPIRNALGAIASVLFLGVIIWACYYGYQIDGITGLIWYLVIVLISGFLAVGNGIRVSQ